MDTENRCIKIIVRGTWKSLYMDTKIVVYNTDWNRCITSVKIIVYGHKKSLYKNHYQGHVKIVVYGHKNRCIKHRLKSLYHSRKNHCMDTKNRCIIIKNHCQGHVKIVVWTQKARDTCSWILSVSISAYTMHLVLVICIVSVLSQNCRTDVCLFGTQDSLPLRTNEILSPGNPVQPMKLCPLEKWLVYTRWVFTFKRHHPGGKNLNFMFLFWMMWPE